MLKAQFLVLCVILAGCTTALALPDDIEKCKIDDNKCLLRSANRVLRKYSKGIPEMNLAPLDPFFIEREKFVQDEGIVTIKASGNNTNIYGFSKGKIEKITGFDADLIEIRIKVPKLTFDGKYASVAKVLGLSLNGRGDYKISFNDFVANLQLNLTRVEIDGKNYFKMIDSKFTFNISGGHLNFPSEGYFTNMFLNSSFDLIVKRSLIGTMSKVWAKIFGNYIATILNKNPIEDLFLI